MRSRWFSCWLLALALGAGLPATGCGDEDDDDDGAACDDDGHHGKADDDGDEDDGEHGDGHHDDDDDDCTAVHAPGQGVLDGHGGGGGRAAP